MKKILMMVVIVMGLSLILANASPQQDLKQFRAYFFKKFPGVKLQEFADGIYGIDKQRRIEWEAMEEFPPYEPGLEIGKELFKKYGVGTCFKNGGVGVRQNYPYFDAKSGSVRTLEGDIMACLKRKKVDTKAEKIGYNKGKLAAISAYMAYNSRGKKLNVVVPNDKRALAIYNRGKTHFYAKRGQLNFSCADCHMYQAGMMARGNLLSPALGHVSGFPVYRKSWEAKGSGALAGFGTIQRRYGGCNKQVRAKPLKEKGKQHPEYVALEYFHTYMSNGVKVNGPSIRQ
jgi:sulfur-oxidizing protein SoxA